MTRPRVTTAGQRSAIVRRYVRGWSVRELAAEYDLAYGTVHRVLTEAEVPMRPRGRRPAVDR